MRKGIISKTVVSGLIASAALMSSAHASIISTQFNTSDGFVTGDTNDITLTSGSAAVTFSGGQQQQMFDLQSYNMGPAGFLFINGTFTGGSGNTASGDGIDDDSGLIDFNAGATEVSFFAANRANGPGTTLNIFGIDDTTLLGTILITETSNQNADGAALTSISSSTFGGLIGSIGIDLPGPNQNPAYVLAIDDFSATVVPLPAALPFFLASLAGLGVVGRRRKAKNLQVSAA